MNNSLISKYIPLNTIIHNLDPRAKIFFVILYLIDVFIAYNVLEFSILFFNVDNDSYIIKNKSSIF